MRSDSRLIPLIERSRSSGRSAAPRSYSSAYARTAESGVRSSCEASATKRRSLRSDASCARKDASIRASIDVQREAEAADLRSFVRALDPRREVAGRDRGGGAADLLERAQAEPHEPQAERDDRTEHDGGHDELDQEEPVERRTRRPRARWRGRASRGRAPRSTRAPGTAAALLARNREVADRLVIPGLPRRRRRPCRASPATVRPRRGRVAPGRVAITVAPSSERTCTNVPGAQTGSRRRGPGGAGCGPSASSVLSVRSSRNERSDEYVATSATRSPTAASATTASRSRARSDRRLPTATTLRACSPPGGPS